MSDPQAAFLGARAVGARGSNAWDKAEPHSLCHTAGSQVGRNAGIDLGGPRLVTPVHCTDEARLGSIRQLEGAESFRRLVYGFVGDLPGRALVTIQPDTGALHPTSR